MGRKKLVAYYRVSTKGQGESGLGLEGQTAAVAAYAKGQGAEIVRTHVEVETGKWADRPELIKALAHAKWTCATLVIARLVRLARNVAFTANLMDSGVDFVACDNPPSQQPTVRRTPASIGEIRPVGGVQPEGPGEGDRKVEREGPRPRQSSLRPSAGVLGRGRGVRADAWGHDSVKLPRPTPPTKRFRDVPDRPVSVSYLPLRREGS
jgi:hypothetical protein